MLQGPLVLGFRLIRCWYSLMQKSASFVTEVNNHPNRLSPVLGSDRGDPSDLENNRVCPGQHPGPTPLADSLTGRPVSRCSGARSARVDARRQHRRANRDGERMPRAKNCAARVDPSPRRCQSMPESTRRSAVHPMGATTIKRCSVSTASGIRFAFRFMMVFDPISQDALGSR